MKVLKLKVILLFIASLILASCDNERITSVSPLLGDYKLIEYTSNISIDINDDNIKSKNLYEELNEFYFSRMSKIFNYDLQITDYYNIRIYTLLPVQMANDPIPGSGTFGNLFPAYELNLSQNLKSIVSYKKVYDELVNPSSIKEINVENQDKIILICDQFFYDYIENSWIKIETRSTFKKI